MKRYVIAVLALFFIMIFGIMLIGGGSSDDDKEEPESSVNQKAIYEYADSPVAKVVYTTQGRVVGDDQYSSIRITVSRDSRKAEVLDGYTNNVQKSQTFPNNQAAFDTFLRSLNNSGYMTTRESTSDDERGVCSAGYRYIYELRDGNDEVLRTWSTSCGTKEGPFAGNASAVRQLFQAQITDYNKFVSGVTL